MGAASPTPPLVPALDLALLLAQLLAVLALGRLVGALAMRLGQPRAVGEIVAGLLLGPTLLGGVLPGVQRALFPLDRLLPLQTLSQLGVLLFLFVVGLRLDLATLRGHARTAVAASYASILVPLVLGAALALRLPGALAGPAGQPLPFALFVGTALAVTAFPVLATIVEERGMARTRMGALALAAAAVDDVTAWAILAAIVGTARAGGGLAALATTLVATAVIVGGALAVRPLLGRLADRLGARGRGAPAGSAADPARTFLPIALALLLACAWATERAGVHALFGAFLAGVVVPRGERLAERLADRLADPVALLLLPTFFAFTGLRTTVQLGSDAATWGALAGLLAVAVVGKLGASAVAARLTGETWRDAVALGALLNTRGLMALVVVGVGLDAGVIAPALHGLMVLVALLTTMMTTPLLALTGHGTAPLAARRRRTGDAPPHPALRAE